MRNLSSGRAPNGRGLSTALVTMMCAAAIAACGSSSTSSSDTASGPALTLAECMRSHGVTNFPDPGAHGLVIPDSIDIQTPAFKAAQHACANLGSMPTPGGAAQRAASESAKIRMLGLARCVRKHGLSNFPDPTTSPPTSHPPSYGRVHGNVIGIDGVYLQLPPQSPALNRAMTDCGNAVPSPR